MRFNRDIGGKEYKMSAIVLLVIAAVVFLCAYLFYGSWLAKKWGFDPSRKTPAHEFNDGIDYAPAKAPVLLGHHFSSIAGAGPIAGPIQAAVFGWLPVFLWVVIGSIFFGGVHDMGALFLSVRNKGKSLGESIGISLGKTGRILFSAFSWLTLLLVVAAFANIVANTFVASPAAATASMLFMILAVAFGLYVYRGGGNLVIGTVVGVIGMIVSIWLGNKFPLALSAQIWMYILLAYIFIASVAPVWILLQPRDYLNSYLLYAMIIGGVIGIIIYNPTLVAPAVTSFTIGEGPGAQYMFPMLFVTVACGAISGFHSLVGSGTTSKQLDNEKDMKLVGYGSMLIEGLLAVVSVITIAYVAKGEGTPVQIFANGVGTFMTSFGVPMEFGVNFTSLAISAFALTSLDTATRLARFIFQEAFTKEGSGEKESKNILTNRYVSTAITVAIAGWLGFGGYSAIWPIFGSANQLLAALALIALAVALKEMGKTYQMIVVPMIFMFIVTITALGFLINTHLTSGNYILLFFGIALMILAIILAFMAYKAFNRKTSLEQSETGK